MFAWRDGADILHGFRNLSSSLNEKKMTNLNVLKSKTERTVRNRTKDILIVDRKPTTLV
jgi:hypothetical protein